MNMRDAGVSEKIAPGFAQDWTAEAAVATCSLHALFAGMALCVLLLSVRLFAQNPIPPDWCRALPRPEYKTIERVPISDPWYEVYKPAPGVFAIYEPHQSEESSVRDQMILFLAY